MKKAYVKPDVEYIKLVAQEAITDDDEIDAEPGVDSAWDDL